MTTPQQRAQALEQMTTPEEREALDELLVAAQEAMGPVMAFRSNTAPTSPQIIQFLFDLARLCMASARLIAGNYGAHGELLKGADTDAVSADPSVENLLTTRLAQAAAVWATQSALMPPTAQDARDIATRAAATLQGVTPLPQPAVTSSQDRAQLDKLLAKEARLRTEGDTVNFGLVFALLSALARDELARTNERLDCLGAAVRIIVGRQGAADLVDRGT